jgi:hypothetical protein
LSGFICHTRGASVGPQQHFAFNFYRNAKRQFGHANGAPSMGADLRAEQFKDQFGKAINDRDPERPIF